jgi:hypothetical protein
MRAAERARLRSKAQCVPRVARPDALSFHEAELLLVLVP